MSLLAGQPEGKCIDSDREECWAIVNTVMNIRVPEDVTDILIS
jgi:hypothetical protein